MQQTTFDRPTFDRMPLLLLLLYDRGSGIHLFMNPVLTSTLMIEPSLCPPLCKFSYFISPPCRLFNLSVLAHSLNADDDDVLIFDRSDCITDSLYIHTSAQKLNNGSSCRGGSHDNLCNLQMCDIGVDSDRNLMIIDAHHNNYKQFVVIEKHKKKLQMSPCGNLLLRMRELDSLILRAIGNTINASRLVNLQAFFASKIYLPRSFHLCKPLMFLLRLTTTRLQRSARRHMSTSGLSLRWISVHW